MGCHTFLGMPISSRLALGGCSVYHCRPKRDRSVCPPHPNCVQVGCFECVCSERDVIAGCVHLRCTRSVGCVCPVFVTVDEVGLGSSSFPSAGAVLFVCVDLAWDPVMRFVCFLCGIRFSEHWSWCRWECCHHIDLQCASCAWVESFSHLGLSVGLLIFSSHACPIPGFNLHRCPMIDAPENPASWSPVPVWLATVVMTFETFACSLAVCRDLVLL